METILLLTGVMVLFGALAAPALYTALVPMLRSRMNAHEEARSREPEELRAAAEKTRVETENATVFRQRGA